MEEWMENGYYDDGGNRGCYIGWAMRDRERETETEGQRREGNGIGMASHPLRFIFIFILYICVEKRGVKLPLIGFQNRIMRMINHLFVYAFEK